MCEQREREGGRERERDRERERERGREKGRHTELGACRLLLLSLTVGSAVDLSD